MPNPPPLRAQGGHQAGSLRFPGGTVLPPGRHSVSTPHTARTHTEGGKETLPHTTPRTRT
ncbi:hypothetical protein [Streptomyces anulatus]|uniref:hypothetical protein n=1 Tax=Streptomyces anulatus TaxID=1892 RepID=UPI003246A63D